MTTSKTAASRRCTYLKILLPLTLTSPFGFPLPLTVSCPMIFSHHTSPFY